jgi:site-specific DNA recombinase
VFAKYKRVSDQGTRADDRLRSPEFQDAVIDAKALRDGLVTRDYPTEIDVSGSKASRAILDEIVAAVEAGELAGVIVAKLDRLSRLAPRDRLELFERIEGAGGQVLSASEELDVSTPEGRFAREVFLGVARMEWEKKRDGFNIARAAAIAKGIPIKVRANYGLEIGPDRKYVPVAGEREIVVELFERRYNGGDASTAPSFGELLVWFEAITGRKTYRSTLKEMLGNRVYIGWLEHGRTPATYLVNTSAHEAIVDPALFEGVQEVNAARAGVRGSKRPKALYSGIARCQGCGWGLRNNEHSQGRRRYVCQNDHCEEKARIGAEELEAYVLEAVLEWAGPLADELVELELELDARADRVVLEHRLERAQAALVAYMANVELELEIGTDAYEAGRRARVELVETCATALEAIGQATELEIVRGTLRTVLADPGEFDVDERRRLLDVAIGALVVRRTPYKHAPTGERVLLLLTEELGPAGVSDEDSLELLQHETTN